MDRIISVRGRVAATIALLLALCAPTTARAAGPSVSCDLHDDVLTVTLAAREVDAAVLGTEARITLVDRAGTVGVHESSDGTVTPIDCGGARVGDLVTIAVQGSAGVDVLRISEEGVGGRSFPFPATVAFDVDLGDEVSAEPVGDLLELVVRSQGGSASIGDDVFSLGSASGTLLDAESGMLRVETSRSRRTGTGPLILDGSQVPDGFDLALIGGSGADVLRGGPADDVLVGAEGADLLEAGGGDGDVIDGGPGRDRCSGGEDTTSCETPV